MTGWWQLEEAANLVIALAYLGIFALIIIPLVKLKQVRSNKLGTATAAIFFSCAVGHGMHALHPAQTSGQLNQAHAMMTTWWSASCTA